MIELVPDFSLYHGPPGSYPPEQTLNDAGQKSL